MTDQGFNTAGIEAWPRDKPWAFDRQFIDSYNQLAYAASKFEEIEGPIHDLLVRRRPLKRQDPQPLIPAMIIGSDIVQDTPMIPRWRYDVRVLRKTWEISGLDIVVPDFDFDFNFGANGPFAWNIREFGHVVEPVTEVQWIVWGENVHGADWPPDIRPKPVGGGGAVPAEAHKQDTPVFLQQVTDSSGNPLYLFSAMGSNDGLCPLPEP